MLNKCIYFRDESCIVRTISISFIHLICYLNKQSSSDNKDENIVTFSNNKDVVSLEVIRRIEYERSSFNQILKSFLKKNHMSFHSKLTNDASSGKYMLS